MRLQRHGRRKAPFYHIVAAHNTSPRDGKFIERIGYYNPTKVPAEITLDTDRAIHWLINGAEASTTVHAILKYKGVLYKKHLLRGLKKGALTQEQVDEKFAEWENSHRSAVMDHVKTIEDRAAKAKAEEKARIEAKRKSKEEAEAKAKAEAEAQRAEEAAAAQAENEAPVAEDSTADATGDAQSENTAETNTDEESTNE